MGEGRGEGDPVFTVSHQAAPIAALDKVSPVL
jgi:hypothetical protein